METILMIIAIAAVAALVVTLVKLRACRRDRSTLDQRVREWEELWERHESVLKEQSQR